MEKNKFLTEKERERARRDNAIRTDYAAMHAANPEVSNNRLYGVLAEKWGLSRMMILFIVQGKYAPKQTANN